MTEEQKKAFEALENFVYRLSEAAGKDKEFAVDLWKRISHSQGVLMELAYYHDKGEFWDKHVVAGYHLTDIIVWQVDHFKAYMDRSDDMNRFRQERLLLESLDIMLKMELDPEPYIKKMRDESGTDFDQRVL